MKKLVVIFLLLTAIIAAVIFYVNRPRLSPQAATLVPETTLAFVSIADFQKSRANFARTPLHALWDEPQVQAFLEKPLAAWRASLTGDSKGDSSTRIDQALALPQGEFFVAITSLTVAPQVHLGLLAGCDVQSRRLLAEGYLKLYERQLLKYNPNARSESKTYLGIDYTLWQTTPDSALCHTFLGSLLVFSLDEDNLRDAIARFTRKLDTDVKALAGSARYNAALEQLPATREGQVFLNVEQLVNQFGMFLMMAGPAGSVFQNITKMQAVAASVSCGEQGLTDVTQLTYLKDHAAEPATQFRTLRVAPADTGLYASQTANLAASYTQLMGLLARFGNPQTTEIAANLDKFLANAGVRMADDFLAHLGPEVGYIGNWRQGARAPDFAVVAEVKNRAALQPKYDQIVTASRQAMPLDDLAHAGEALHIVRTGTSYLSPTAVLTDRFYILASTPDYARELVTQLKSGTTSLADAPDYKRTVGRVPAGGADLTYCDLRQFVGGLYTLARANAPKSDDAAVFRWDKLPDTEVVTRHLGQYASTSVVREPHDTTTTFSALGKPGTTLVTLAAGIAAAQPLLAQLPPLAIPGLPTMSSDTPAPRPPPGSQTATSQTPAR